MDKTAIRHAATVILLRDASTNPRILMGQRGHAAAFMPNKFVFPGGALDPVDSEVKLAHGLSELCMTRLSKQSDAALVTPLILAAIREVWEETGLLLGEPSTDAKTRAAQVPADWASFYAQGVEPSGEGMKFVFRAITPPGRPRRFDARFFLVDAAQVIGDLDDFTHATDELSHLQWIPLSEARAFDLPFITEVVLAEIEADLEAPGRNASIPFFYNEDGRSNFSRL